MVLQEEIPEQMRGIVPPQAEQISQAALAILKKVFAGNALQDKEKGELFNRTEAAALLGVLYRRPVRPRYMNELTREFLNKESGHVTPARLPVAKVAGKTYLYRVGDILAVKLRGERGE